MTAAHLLTELRLELPLTRLEIAGKLWGPAGGVPVLALHGWLDNAASFDRLAPLLPEEGGHHVHLDTPELVAPLVSRMLAVARARESSLARSRGGRPRGSASLLPDRHRPCGGGSPGGALQRAALVRTLGSCTET